MTFTLRNLRAERKVKRSKKARSYIRRRTKAGRKLFKQRLR